MKKWYCQFDGLEFVSIFEDDPETVDPMMVTEGPFDTSREAKKAAIERYKVDLETIKRNMSEIRAYLTKELEVTVPDVRKVLVHMRLRIYGRTVLACDRREVLKGRNSIIWEDVTCKSCLSMKRKIVSGESDYVVDDDKARKKK